MSKHFFRDWATKFFTARWPDKDLREFQSQQEVGNEKNPEEPSMGEEADLLAHRLLKRINREIDEAEKEDKKSATAGLPLGPPLKVLHPWRPTMRLAAVIAMVLGIGVAMTWHLNLRDKGPSVGETIVWHNASPQAKQYTMSDGSTVWLNTGTQLSLPKEFSADLREVTLQGEAFFEVAKDAQRPFIINAGNLVTRVLGTSFNIKAFEGQDVEVAVVTGRVVVEKKKNQEISQPTTAERIELRPQEKAVFDHASQRIERHIVLPGTSPGLWKEEQLLFEQVLVGEVIRTLRNKHHIVIETESEAINNCKVTVDLTGQTAESAVKIVSELINAEFRLEANKIIMAGEGCPAP